MKYQQDKVKRRQGKLITEAEVGKGFFVPIPASPCLSPREYLQKFLALHVRVEEEDSDPL